LMHVNRTLLAGCWSCTEAVVQRGDVAP